MSKKSSYFKSKKGFSLIELLCAVVIMALVVSATATGLAVSFESIMLGSAKDQASAKAQEFCDIIMTYVEYVPSNDPDGTYLGASQEAKEQLFDTRNSTIFKSDIQNAIKNDVRDGTYLDAIQVASTSLISTQPFVDAVPVYVVERNGKFSDASGKIFVSYQVTVYLSYEQGERTTSCTGTVIKPQLAS